MLRTLVLSVGVVVLALVNWWAALIAAALLVGAGLWLRPSTRSGPTRTLPLLVAGALAVVASGGSLLARPASVHLEDVPVQHSVTCSPTTFPCD